jgi:hypothetical protein
MNVLYLRSQRQNNCAQDGRCLRYRRRGAFRSPRTRSISSLPQNIFQMNFGTLLQRLLQYTSCLFGTCLHCDWSAQARSILNSIMAELSWSVYHYARHQWGTSITRKYMLPKRIVSHRLTLRGQILADLRTVPLYSSIKNLLVQVAESKFVLKKQLRQQRKNLVKTRHISASNLTVCV